MLCVAVLTSTRLTLAAVAMGTVLILVSRVCHTQELPPLSDVETTVFDETGAVIPDSEIVFRSDYKPIVSHTGSDGAVTIRLPSGTYTVTASKAGFVRSKILDVQVITPTPQSLRVVLKVDQTASYDPFYDPFTEVVSTVDFDSAEGPSFVDAESPVPTVRPSRKNRSCKCLYLWKCSAP
jgi:carboxypeptidase family protein